MAATKTSKLAMNMDERNAVRAFMRSEGAVQDPPKAALVRAAVKVQKAVLEVPLSMAQSAAIEKLAKGATLDDGRAARAARNAFRVALGQPPE